MDEYMKDQYKAALSIISLLPFYDKCRKEQYIDYKMRHKNLPWVDVITQVNIGLDEEFYTNVHEIDEPGRSTVLVNKYNRLSQNYIPEDLETMDPSCNPEGLMLRHEARIAFEEMCSDAYREGISLKAVSTFRSFYYQWKVYLDHITPYMPIEEYQRERDKVSARPGHSEHQTGLAVDINELEPTFEDTPEGKWLAQNSFQYGFILRYPRGKEAITGYDYEPWHFRFLGKELAQAVHFSNLTYDEFYARYINQTGQDTYFENECEE